MAFASALLLPQSSLVPAGLRGCDAMLGNAPAWFEREVTVSGAGPLRETVSMHPGQELLFLAREKGVDVLLSASRGDALLRADSPLHGFGVQHLLLPGETGNWQLQVSAKDPDAPPGVVVVRAVHLPVTGRRDCVRLQRALVSADAAYAQGWAIRNEVTPATSEDAADVAYRTSVDGYRKVLAEPVPQPLRGTMLLSVAGGHYHGLSNWPAAQAWAARAARLYHRAQDDYASAQSRSLRAIALIEVDPESFPDSLMKAEGLLRAAARTHAARGEHREQALALNNLGIALYLAGRYADARRAYETAARLFEALHEQTRAWQVADNMGLIDYELGRLETAARTYQALTAQPGLRARPRLYLNVLTNGALVQLERGEAGEALRAYQEALSLARDIQDEFVVGLSLQGIGGAYEALGDPDMARTHYQAALRLRTREASARYRLETLWSLGDVERRLGRAGRALALDREALALADTDLDRARMHLRIAADFEALGQSQQALAQLAPLFDQPVPGDGFIHAQALLLRGRMHAAAAMWRAAGSDLRVALQAFEQLDSASGQFHARMAIAALERDRGAPAAAVEEVDAAIALAERLRLQSANPGLRASLLETLRPAYDLKIELLGAASAMASTAALREQLAWKALEVAESARARAMQDYAAMAAEGTAASALLASRRALYVELAQAQARLDRASLGLPADDPVLQTVRETVAALRGQIDQLESRMAPEQDSGATSRRPPVLRATLLPPDIAMVQYWLGGSRTFAWVASAGSLRMLDLGPSTRIAEAAATTQAVLRDSRTSDATVRLQALQHLSGLIWQPLAALVPARASVVFMPDMTLHYIPFAALIDGPSGRFLVQDRDVATAASLRQLLETSPLPQRSGQRMLIVADPRYGPGLDPLPATAREADAITRIATALQVDRLQGPQATRARFLGAPLGDYQFIHVATHALANARIPQLSALQLAASDAGEGDDRVYAADLLGVKLNAQLVVLSACDTALGRVVSGEGVIGLRYVLLARGAQAVVSSLWQVGDRHAEEFMTEFYAALLGGGSSSSAAMSAAMRSLMARHGADPAAWAAFELSVRSLPAAWPGPPGVEE